MKQLNSLFALTVCLALANVLPALAQPQIGQQWTSNELWSKADLVLIATVSSLQPPQVTEQNWEPVATLFEVQVVLKGKLGSRGVSVWHQQWREREPQVEIVDGVPPIEQSYIKFDPLGGNQYLIFLKSKPEESIQPLTGPFDDASSFLRLEPYDSSKEQVMQREMDEKK